MNGRIGASVDGAARLRGSLESSSLSRSPLYRQMKAAQEHSSRCRKIGKFLIVLSLVLLALVVSTVMATPAGHSTQPQVPAATAASR